MEQVDLVGQQQQEKLPILVLYHQQLDTFKQQRDMVKTQLEQLHGVVFACEQMIKQYEDHVKAESETMLSGENSNEER